MATPTSSSTRPAREPSVNDDASPTAHGVDLFESAPVPYLTVDGATRILRINRVAVTLLERERGALLGRRFAELLSPEERARFEEHVAECMAGRAVVATELHLGDGMGRCFRVLSSPERGGDGVVAGCRTTLTEITDLRRGEQSLRRSIAMRETFLAVVAHDLRNPLNTILMGAEVVLASIPRDDRRQRGRRQLELIKQASERMTRLIADLLDVSSMEAGHLSIRWGRQLVAELLGAAQSVMTPIATDKGIDLAVERDARATTFHGDRERVLQVLMNLVGNAIKFTPAGGRIHVAARPVGAMVEWTVRDDGVGMSAEQLARAFEPYWQGGTLVREGAGLGLSICKSIVELHGGKIRAISAPGHGTTIHFTVPTNAPRLPPLRTRHAARH